jgi:hypothetical protein
MKIEKFNEFFSTNSDSILDISKLIEITEMTNKSDLEEISKGDDYRKIVNFGKSIIPILLERNSIIWDKALSELTGVGLDPLKYSTSDLK